MADEVLKGKLADVEADKDLILSNGEPCLEDAEKKNLETLRENYNKYFAETALQDNFDEVLAEINRLQKLINDAKNRDKAFTDLKVAVAN